MDDKNEKILLRTIGRRIRRIRQFRGKSQEKLAQEIDRERQLIIDIEYGRNNITLRHLLKISIILGIQIKTWFVTNKDWNTFYNNLDPKKEEEELEIPSV